MPGSPLNLCFSFALWMWPLLGNVSGMVESAHHRIFAWASWLCATRMLARKCSQLHDREVCEPSAASVRAC